MERVDRLFHHPLVEVGRSTLVAGNRRGDRVRNDDQVHDGVFHGGHYRQCAVDRCAPLFEKSLAVGRRILSLLVFLPNMLWQIKHDFISLDFLQGIHARDVREGRADDYLIGQFVLSTNVVAIPLWITGLYYYFTHQDGKRFRMLGWIFVITFVIYFIAQGLVYYQAPAYPMLIAAGAVVWQGRVEKKSADAARADLRSTWISLAFGAIFAGAVTLPIAPINSPLFNAASEIHDLFTEQIGWHEMIKTVGDIYADLPAEEKAQTGILTGENDEAAALNIYGGEYSLPKAISGSDTFWLRGYGDPPPATVITVGLDRSYLSQFFEQCTMEGTITNSYGIDNDLANPSAIYVCRKARLPWDEIWQRIKRFS